MKTTMKILSACLACAFCLTVTNAAPVTLLNDVFDSSYLSGGGDPDKKLSSAQSLPNSAEWFVSYPDGNTSDTANVVFSPTTGMTLRKTDNTNGVNVMAYFTENRSSFQSLSVGASLELTFSLSVLNPRDTSKKSLNFGLFNSGGNQLEQGYYTNGAKQAKIMPFSGYLIMTNAGNQSSSWQTTPGFRNSSNSIYSIYNTTEISQPTGDPDSRFGGGPIHNTPLNLANATTYNGSFMITRNAADENTIVFTLNGTTILSTIDTEATLFAFDTINFGYGGTDIGDAMTLNNIKLVYTVPEPAVLTLLLLAAAPLAIRNRLRGRGGHGVTTKERGKTG